MIFNEISNVFELCATHYDSETLQHCVRVAKMAAANPAVESQDEREVIYQVALCHDLLEDTSCTTWDIAQAMNGSESFVENVIGLLTRNTDETYDDYIGRLRSSRNKIAYIVKLCDIKDHLTQKETLTDSLKERYLKVLPVLL